MMVPDQHKILAISSDKDLKEKNKQSAAKQGLNEYSLHFTSPCLRSQEYICKRVEVMVFYCDFSCYNPHNTSVFSKKKSMHRVLHSKV
jgi:hypothetical protein